MTNPFKKESTIIIATLGPSTFKDHLLKKVEDRGVDFVRINLSHTPIDKVEETVQYITDTIATPLMIDTEGSQVRTGDLGVDSITLTMGKKIKVYNKHIVCDEGNIYIRPEIAVDQLQVGSLIFIDFDTIILRVDFIEGLKKNGYIICSVLSGGGMGNNKAVTIQQQGINLPALSEKDVKSLEIAKKYNIRFCSMSFIDSADDVLELKKLHPNLKVVAKIETEKGVNNLDEILDVTDGILIDRGDLSREIPLERIAFAQKVIINKANAKNIPVFVATNLLDTMMNSLRPSRAEVNDIVNTLLDGVNGLVLAAETAIGKNPIQTIDFMMNLCRETQEIQKSKILEGKDVGMGSLDAMKYITSPVVGSSLIKPHGGKLINRMFKTVLTKDAEHKMGILKVSKETVMDAEQIAIGAFSPLEGFLCENDFNSVLDEMRLSDGTVWTIPIIIQIDKMDAKRLEKAPEVLLVDDTGSKIAILHNESIFMMNKPNVLKKLFGTDNPSHPGVNKVLAGGDYIIGGKIELLQRSSNNFQHYELTPTQTRKIFESLNWKKIVGFHTRNVIHRSHEFIQLEAMKTAMCDGLFVHPIIGEKKKGDFQTEYIIKSYELMMKHFYPKNEVVLSAFATFSRYAGPREAIFTAICRQNFGCSHFIVGRDHTGVGEFYVSDASHKIFDQFPDLDIKPVIFDQVIFNTQSGSYQLDDLALHNSETVRDISGTKMREMLKNKEMPPNWFMRPEIATYLINRIKNRSPVFVE